MMPGAAYGHLRRGLAGLAVALLAACGTAPAAPPSPDDNGPERQGAGGAELLVQAHPLDAPLVLDSLPPGTRVRHIRFNPTYDGRPEQWATLYGDPDLGDTLDGPLLLVSSSSGSASIGGPPSNAEDSRVVDLGGHDGFLIDEADWTWVGDTSGQQDYVEFVVGRGLSDEQLIRAAAAASYDDQAATVAPDAVPAGLAPLIVAGPRDGPWSGVGEELSIELEDGSPGGVLINAVRADPRLAALWGFWTADPVGTVVRGQPGSAGVLRGTVKAEQQPGRVWAEAGMVFSVYAYGGAADLVDEVVDSIRLGTDAEFLALGQELVEREPTAEDIGCRPGALVASSLQGDARWVFALSSGPRFDFCTGLVTVEGPHGSGGSGSFPMGPVGEVSVVSNGHGSLPSATHVTILGGVAPPGTTRVTITGPDGVVVDAVLSVDGPRPGERLFGIFISAPADAAYGPFVVTALDAAGTVLHSVTI